MARHGPASRASSNTGTTRLSVAHTKSAKRHGELNAGSAEGQLSGLPEWAMAVSNSSLLASRIIHGASHMVRLFLANCRNRYAEWQHRHLESEIWARLRAIWEQR